MTKKEGTLRK